MPNILTSDEINRLENYTRMSPCGLMIKLIVRMGIRHAEALELRVEDFDIESRRISVRGANSREVPVPEEMTLPLMQTVHGREETAYIVSNCLDGRRPLGARTFQAFIARIADQLEMPGVNSKNLRATCIVNKLAAGFTPEEIQLELGIRSRRSVMRYAEENAGLLLMGFASRHTRGLVPATKPVAATV